MQDNRLKIVQVLQSKTPNNLWRHKSGWWLIKRNCHEGIRGIVMKELAGHLKVDDQVISN